MTTRKQDRRKNPKEDIWRRILNSANSIYKNQKVSKRDALDKAVSEISRYE